MDSIEIGFYHTLLSWFDRNARELEFRENRTPYKVWISEVMLQQTQVARVELYLERWLSLFPDIYTLSIAPEDLLMKAWEGLGYYSRVRNLQKAAQKLIALGYKELPHNREIIASLPGIGRYTLGAILAFGFGDRALAIDANVIRFASRYFGFQDPVSPLLIDKIERSLQGSLELEHAPKIAEALIEIGSQLCSKTPKCTICPFSSSCKGKSDPEKYPLKKQAKQTTFLERTVIVFIQQGKWFLSQRKKGEIMHGLWEFPYREGVYSLKQVQEEFGLKSSAKISSLPIQKSSFTYFRVTWYPFFIENFEGFPPFEGEWIPIKEVENIAFSSGHAKIQQALFLTDFLKNHKCASV